VAEAPGLRLNCLLALDDGTVYVGAGEARLLRLRAGRLERVASFDEVEGRVDWYTPWGGPPDVRSLSADPAGVVYAGVHVGGIVWSADDGETWVPSDLDIDVDVHQALAHPTDSRRVLAATAYGLAESRDGGDSWTIHDEGLHATYSRAVAASVKELFLSTSRGHTGEDAAVYRFRDGEFTRVTGGLPETFDDNVDTHLLAADGRHVAIGTGDGRVFASSDEGRTWRQVAEELGRVTCLLLARSA
jgi:hypothetical protein